LGGAYAGRTIWLARGSYWREQISTTDAAVTVRGYGSGRLPVIDARDIISTGAWSKTGGFTSVYQATWTPVAGTQVAPSLWENGQRLVRVATIAACDALPGSYFASTTYSNGVPGALYVHATDSGDPASNGAEYQQAVRYNCIKLGDRAQVSDVRCIGNQHDNGAVELGRFSTAERLVLQDGTKHHMFIASGEAVDCVAYLSDPTYSVFGTTTTTAFVAYNTANARDPIRWKGCVYIASATDTAINNASAFYAHAQAAQVSFGAVVIEDCEGYQSGDFVLGAAQAERLQISKCLTYNCGRFLSNSAVDSNLAGGTDIVGAEWVIDRDMTEITFRGFFRPQSNAARTVRVRDSVAVLMGGAVGRLAQDPFNYSVSGAAGSLLLERVACLQAPISGTQQSCAALKFQATTGTLAVTVRNCLVQGWGSFQSSGARGFHLDVRQGVTTFAASDNVFQGYLSSTERGAVRRDDTTYDTATAYLTAVQPGENAGSLSVEPLQVEGSLFRRDYFVDLDARAQGCVPQIEIKGAGEPLRDRWRRMVREVEAA
jgi:hypothetical protein